MHFREYQRKAMTTLRPDPAGADPTETHLLGLVAEVAAVADEHRRHRRDGRQGWSKARLREEIGDALWYLAALAEDYQLDLADIAAANLDKVARRWLPTSPNPQCIVARSNPKIPSRPANPSSRSPATTRAPFAIHAQCHNFRPDADR